METCLWCGMDAINNFSSSFPRRPPNESGTQGNINPTQNFNNITRPDSNGWDNTNTDNDQNDDVNINCNCKQPAVSRRVLKPGPNCGKEFFCCAKRINDSERCNFYKWAHDLENDGSFKTNTQMQSHQTKNNSFQSQYSQRSIINDFQSQKPSSPVPNCECGVQAITRTTKKEGPNLGREFYACSKPQSDSSICKFFTWSDESKTVANFKEYQNASSTTSDPNEAKCHCDLYAVKKMTVKGENNGREFFTCVKSSGKCNYFEWADEVGKKPHQTNISNRACYKCGQEGHMANNCINGQSSSKDSSNYKCYKCGQEGHMANNCSNGQGVSKPMNITCFKCGDDGHLSTNCTNDDKGKGKKRTSSTRGTSKKYGTPKRGRGGKKGSSSRQSSMKL